MKYSDHSVFVYFLGIAKDIFPDPAKAPNDILRRQWLVRRECRGLVFHKDGRVLARRFHKFFNGVDKASHLSFSHSVNETEETATSKIDLTQPFFVTEKVLPRIERVS